MNVLALLLFVTRVATISGRLTVLRGREETRRYTHSSRKLLCASEDDGGGLIWNSNLNWEYSSYEFSDRGGHTDFHYLNAYQKREIDCDLNSHDVCMSTWENAGWNLTNSKVTPMGPVFDRRWEDFTEHNNIGNVNEYRLTDKLTKSGAFVVSIRGSTDAHILLCDTEYYALDFCYWIIIGGWSNRKSVIRKCAKGVPDPTTYPAESACAQIRASCIHTPLSPTEWRTFIVTWDDSAKTISVYDTQKLLMTFKDDDEQSRNQSSYYNLYLRSSRAMLFRFHIYSFLRTTDPKAALTSPVLRMDTINLCIEMIIGLCKECEMKIVLVDPFDEGNEESLVTIERPDAYHRLATWQFVRINKTILSDFGNIVKIKLIPGLQQKSLDPLWAVANVRVCPAVGTVRYGSMEATQDYDYKYFWPNVTCQKLLYNEDVVVSSVPDATTSLEFDDLYCPEGKVGPYCSISCYDHLENNLDCRGTVICDTRACTCPPGFLDANCHTNCYSGKYGQGCRKTCGSCHADNCSFMTGHCKTGCDNSKRYHIPPFCKIGIDTPPAPDIDFINETTIRVILSAKKEYKLISSGYQFIIRKEGDANGRLLGSYIKIFNNTSTMVGYTNDLEPGISYRIACILYVDNDFVPIHGEWRNFTTRCTSTANFEVEVGNTTLLLKRGQEVDSLYSCPSKWYNFVFENLEADSKISKGSLSSLPYEFAGLTPYTLYKITISKERATLFSQEVRTLDGAPSQVRNIRKILLSNEEITLKWDPPLHLNGIIQKYKIVLQVQRYFGCEDLKVQPLRNDSTSIFTAFPSITFSDLIPYAHYVAKVVAYTTYRGPEVQVEFSTNQTEIPSELYSNLRFQDYVLMWDAPKDCTTISGPIVASIVVTGVSGAVTNFATSKQTIKYSLNMSNFLYGAETYEARVYAIRDYDKEHNKFRFVNLFFTTPPKVPPPVRNLEIYEIESRTRTVHLRWLKPEPPLNGEIQHYIVSGCRRSCEIVSKIQAMEHCELWDKYVCATVKQLYQATELIKVSAVNANVSTPSTALSVPISWNEIRPDAPDTFTVQVLEKGVVSVTWSHPWKTGGRLQKFVISAEMTSSRLRMQIQRSQTGMLHEYQVTEYRPWYNEKLYLFSSSMYRLSIRAVTNAEVYGERKLASVQTPLAMAFEKELTTEVCDADSTILLHIPRVLNDTKNSVTTVVVKGPQACENHTKLSEYLREKTDIGYYDVAWRAATFFTDQFAGKTLTIGDNKVYGGARNCPLKSAESYVILVIVLTKEGWTTGNEIMVTKTISIRVNEVPKRHEAWLIPITIFLVIGTVIFYFYRRRRRSLKTLILQEEMAWAPSSENLEVKSISSSSKQALTVTPTLSDNEFLSRGSTPQDDNAICVNDANQREDRVSLVKVKDFEDYVRQAIESGLLDKQYNGLPRGQTKPWEYGKLPQNKSKNRYGNLIAYDENRVVLEKLPDDPYSDYINASYIKGYKKEKFYIATQGPKANTVIDFWRMIWQEESYIICMLANLIEEGKIKCEQYWPDIGKKKKYGDITVFNAKHTVFANFTFRVLHVSCGDEARKIEHLHYTAWPDHGVPLFTHSVVTYLKKLLATPPGNGPVVVHCSAGVGRTGTIILCDICLRRAAAEGVVDVHSETEAIRSERANMVNTKQQYLLAHLTLVECLLSFPTSLSCNEALSAKITNLKKQLTIQQSSLEKMAWQDEALRPPTSQPTLSERNLVKNRFPELASARINRVYLKRYPPTDEDSDYISAVYVDSVTLQNQYIATQLPLPGTFSDFWRMVAEYKVELIVLLQPPDPKDATCCPIIPCEEFKPVPYINVRAKEFTEFEYYTTQKLILIDNLEKPVTEQQITILCSAEWKAGRNQDPPATMSLVTLWQASVRTPKGDGPVVVLCHDGVTGCGLYLALAFLLERMTMESECDVCLAIRAIRKSRPDFVKSLEHMEYLYDAAVTYLKFFETYANFT